MKTTLTYVALVLATLTGVFLLWQFRSVLTIFLFALALAAAMRRPIDLLTGRGLPQGLAVILTYLLGLGLLGAVLYAVGDSLIVEGQAAGKGFTSAWEHIRTNWPAGTPLQQFIAQRLPQPEEIYQAVESGLSLELVQTSLGFTANFFEALSQVALVLVLSIYWSLDRNRIERLWLSMLQAERRIRARTIWQDIEDGVGAHIRTMVTVLMASGLVLALGYSLLGLDAPVTLASIAAVVALVPLLGWALASTPAALVGLIGGPTVAVAAGLYTLVVLLALKLVIAPRFLDRRRYSPILTVVVMLALSDVWGIAGLLMAVPLAAIIHIVLSEFLAPSSRRSRQFSAARTSLCAVSGKPGRRAGSTPGHKRTVVAGPAQYG